MASFVAVTSGVPTKWSPPLCVTDVGATASATAAGTRLATANTPINGKNKRFTTPPQLSEYEDGVRFLQIREDGSIVEQGYFLSLGSSSSSPKWAGEGNVLYSIDYQRGIDILRWKGVHYVPGKKETGRVPGTDGVTRPVAPSRAQAARRDRLATKLRATGWSPWLCSAAGRT